jgi:hypothetical protein
VRVNIDSPKNIRPSDDAIEASDEAIAGPGFDRVGVAHLEQPAVRGMHLGRDPGAILSWPRLRAATDHCGERGVHRDSEAPGADRAPQRSRDLELAYVEDHARIGTPPQQRILAAEPRENALRVRVEEAGRREIATGSQKPVGLLQCKLGRRERIVGIEERNHSTRMLRPDLVAAARCLTRPPVTRFAPSPTGYLHLGHIVNAIYTWGVARALGGRVLLRLEDHDRIRSRPEYEAAILEDLDWLGFVPDEGRHPLMRQSDTPAIYRDALDTLKRTAHVYACDCSRTDIGGERYAGRCRTRGLSEGPGRGVRVHMKEKTVHAHDLLTGPLEQTPAEQCGDLLIRDRDGNWTYQFAVTG